MLNDALGNVFVVIFRIPIGLWYIIIAFELFKCLNRLLA